MKEITEIQQKASFEELVKKYGTLRFKPTVNMQAQKITNLSTYDPDWFDGDLSDVIAKLEELRDNNPEAQVKIEFYFNDDEDYGFGIDMITSETEEARLTRIQREKEKLMLWEYQQEILEAEKLKKEKELYAELKAKFEGE